MRVLIAPDSYGGTMTAGVAAAAIAAGWRRAVPTDELDVAAISDGGPGFLLSLEPALGGRRHQVSVSDPLGRSVDASVLLVGPDAYVESAQACGLHLLADAERDTERASTYGVGQLLAFAAGLGCRRIVVGLGGSATTDGGRGALDALGTEGARLLRALDLVVATDVDNPLLGPHGAAATYAPQKGAERDAVFRLEARLAAYVTERGASDLVDVPGAGAAGGLGFGLFTLGGRRVSGISLVLDALAMSARIARVGLVVTGEGRYDEQSLRGKAVAGVATLAAAEAVPCVVIAGQCSIGRRQAAAHGITELHALADEVGVDAALADPIRHLRDLSARIASQWSRSRTT